MDSLDALLTELHSKYANVGDKPAQDLPSCQPLGEKVEVSNEIANGSNSQDLMQELMGELPHRQSNPLDRLLDDLQKRGQSVTPVGDAPVAMPILGTEAADPIAIAIVQDLREVAVQQRQQERQELVNRATVWLDQVDPLSGDGLWFEEFAKSYPSRLEAAIAMLSQD
ncbi:MAG: hypothetical protein NW214_11265 [Pseudanabaenaceae cyanobacterium bins.39]|nr:hypothetical protein [Pseudanabaenaceae cyanobacterium bins.39]